MNYIFSLEFLYLIVGLIFMITYIIRNNRYYKELLSHARPIHAPFIPPLARGGIVLLTALMFGTLIFAYVIPNYYFMIVSIVITVLNKSYLNSFLLLTENGFVYHSQFYPITEISELSHQDKIVTLTLNNQPTTITCSRLIFAQIIKKYYEEHKHE